MTMDIVEAQTLPDDDEMPTGEEILGYIDTYLDYFVHWPDAHTRRTVALWVMHSHARDDKGILVWQTTPRLWFQSKEAGSGKSWAMAIASFICPKSEIYIEPSEPAVIHTVGKEHGTVFLDECDILLSSAGRKQAVRAIVNGGYTKIPPTNWPRVRNGKVEKIPTFGALSLAGLEELESGTNGHMTALLTRTIRIRMNKAPKSYSPPDFTEDEWEIAEKLRNLVAAWAASQLDMLKAHKPDMPEGVGNRLAQLWKPLLATADVIGGDIPALARKSCVSLTKTATNGMCPEVARETAQDLAGLMEHWRNPVAIESKADKSSLPDLSRFQNVTAPSDASEDDAPTDAPESPLPTTTRTLLLAAMQATSGPHNGAELAHRAGVDYDTARVTLGRMREAGEVYQPSRAFWDLRNNDLV